MRDALREWIAQRVVASNALTLGSIESETQHSHETEFEEVAIDVWSAL